MKSLLALVLITGFSSFSWARTSYETGYGQEFGYCSYNLGSFCVMSIRNRAEAEGKRQADWNCQMKRGVPHSYSAYCNTNCFPNMLLPGDQNVSVRCSSTCTVQCELPD